MKKLILITLLSLLPLTSQALVELRAGYGVATFDDDDYMNLEQEDISGFNLDALVYPPLLLGGFGFGLRYESLGFDLNNEEQDFNRLAVIVNYRIIDTFAHIGVIGTYAIDEELERPNGNTLDADGATYTLGAEALFSLGLIEAGVEIGKMFGEFEVSNSDNISVDSLYAKFLIGIAI